MSKCYEVLSQYAYFFVELLLFLNEMNETIILDCKFIYLSFPFPLLPLRVAGYPSRSFLSKTVHRLNEAGKIIALERTPLYLQMILRLVLCSSVSLVLSFSFCFCLFLSFNSFSFRVTMPIALVTCINTSKCHMITGAVTYQNVFPKEWFRYPEYLSHFRYRSSRLLEKGRR